MKIKSYIHLFLKKEERIQKQDHKDDPRIEEINYDLEMQERRDEWLSEDSFGRH